MSTLSADLAAGQVYYVRVIAAVAASTDSGTIAWSSTSRSAPFQLTVLDPTSIVTPGWLKVTVSNGVDSDTVAFSIDGGATVLTVTLDDTGSIVGTSVPIGTLAAGSHTITATAGTGGVASGTFTVLAAVNYPSGAGADNPASYVSQSGVVKWILQDPQSGGTSYLFPINPNRMTPPQTPRVFNAEHTTATDGQPLVFEGASIATNWTIEGDVLTQAFYEKLEWFNAQPRRFYLIDHLSRAWTVTCESIDWTAKRAKDNPWAHHYKLTMLIHAGPVQLP